MPTSSNSDTTTPMRLAGLDHLRALAIIIVFLWHYRQHGAPAAINEIGLFGWTGVDLFFVLSGYLVGGQILKRVATHRSVSYGDFYMKRFFRIMPAFLVVLTIYFTVPAFHEREGLAPLWRYLTFTQNFGLDVSVHGTFSHAWSLCIEEQFYLLLPVVVLLIAAIPWRHAAAYALLTLFFAGFIVRYYCWQHFVAPLGEGQGLAYFQWIYYPTYARLDGLLAGVSIAALYHFRPQVWARVTQHGNAILLAGLVLLGCAWAVCRELVSMHAAVFGFPLVAVAYGCLVLAALSPSCILYRRPLRVSAWVAAVSYSLYLTHKQLNHLVRIALGKHAIADDSWLMLLACIAIAVAGGALLHYAVERPFLRLRDRILAKRKGAL